jgi:hypothetical protein
MYSVLTSQLIANNLPLNISAIESDESYIFIGSTSGLILIYQFQEEHMELIKVAKSFDKPINQLLYIPFTRQLIVLTGSTVWICDAMVTIREILHFKCNQITSHRATSMLLLQSDRHITVYQTSISQVTELYEVKLDFTPSSLLFLDHLNLLIGSKYNVCTLALETKSIRSVFTVNKPLVNFTDTESYLICKQSADYAFCTRASICF